MLPVFSKFATHLQQYVRFCCSSSAVQDAEPQPAGIHRSFTHLCDGWETQLSLLVDGTVLWKGVRVGGHWTWHNRDNLEVVYHCDGQQEKAQTHQFQSVYLTDAFRLTGRHGRPTYLIPRLQSGIHHSSFDSSGGFHADGAVQIKDVLCLFMLVARG